MIVAPKHPKSDYWKFWSGQTISNMGNSFTQFVFPLLIFQLTGSAINLALVTVSEFLPYLCFGLMIGAWVDRVNRKALMIFCDLMRLIVIGTFPLLGYLHMLPIWWIYLAGFLVSTISIAFNAAEFAAIPSIVVGQDDLMTANGRIQASYSVATAIGPLLAGFLAAFIPLTWLLGVDAVSFLISSITLFSIKKSFQSIEAGMKQSIFHEMMIGLRYVFKHPVLRSISLLLATINFLSSTTTAQLVLFCHERLHVGATQIGILSCAGSIGVVLLSLSAGPLRKRWSFGTIILGTCFLEGVAITLFAFTQYYLVAVILWSLIVGLTMLCAVTTRVLRQTIVPNDMLGRVVSIAEVLAWSAIPLGSFTGALMIEWTQNVALIYGAIGLLIICVALLFHLTPLRKTDLYIPALKVQP